MKKQIVDFTNGHKTGLTVFLLACFWFSPLSAQISTQRYIDSDAVHYYDTKVPSGYRYLYLEAKGGDGGKANCSSATTPKRNSGCTIVLPVRSGLR